MNPWLQVVDLAWRPELHFFERRSPLLREFDEAGLINEFNWGVDSVVLRLGPFEAVRIAVDGMSAYVSSPRSSIDGVRHVVDRTLTTLEPRDVVFTTARVRHLVPVSADRDSAVQSSTASVVGPILSNSRALDYALLVDGLSSRLEATFQLEFGIVSSEEAALRFRMSGSRIGELQMPVTPDVEDLPSCALFVDWTWNLRKPMGVRAVANVITGWDGVLTESEESSRGIWNAHGDGSLEQATRREK
jgi:hypothetical protein